jgi:hypothetical protein
MRIDEIIRNAIPEATEDLCEYILWNRTAYPFEGLTAKCVYKAASRFKRAGERGIQLCDFCDRRAMLGKSVCKRCDTALRSRSD